MSTTLYRDPDYGALAIIEREGGVLEVYNHNFLDFTPVERILNAQASLLGEDNHVSKWQAKVHISIIEANLGRVLRDGGYTTDPLSARAILQVEEEAAVAPDLPTAFYARVSEAVERAISQQLDAALGEVELPGEIISGVLEAFSRPNTKDGLGRNLPFFRARAEVKLSKRAELGEGTCTAWREALKRALGETLVRATVTVDDGVAVFEAAVRPTPEVIDTFESLALPAFAQAHISGYREVHIQVYEDVSAEELERIRGRAKGCTGAMHLEALDKRVIMAKVPSMLEGQHLGDPAFRERVNWLVQEFAGAGGTLGWVGLMRNKHGLVVEGADPQETPGLASLNEHVEQLRAAGYSDDEIKRAATRAVARR